MNNFISGLILLLERPVRARDVVEVDGNHGTIEKIGARSTQIRSTDGRHIIVPNSFFLESNVVNWTLSDDLVRASVQVGVIYGSPTRLVEELIGRVAAEEDAVGVPIWVTEASNNKGGDPRDKGLEYLKFWSELQQRPTVQGVTFFVASASNPQFGEEVWVGRGIGAVLGGR
jgi:small-conductance mechanosensitive channel